MALKITLLLLAAVTCFMASSIAARDLQVRQGFNITARLEAEAQGGLMECWNALTEIKSCSNEIIVFFVNGTTDISPNCCNAITMITHHCWPAMLTALGFTPDETNVLRGYCDASSANSGFGPAAPTPLCAQAPAPADSVGGILV